MILLYPRTGKHATRKQYDKGENSLLEGGFQKDRVAEPGERRITGSRAAVRNGLRPGGRLSGEEFKPAHGRRVPTRVVAMHLRRQERQKLRHGLIGHGALHFAAGLAVRPTETERAAISKRERRAVPEMLEVKGRSAGNATRYQPTVRIMMRNKGKALFGGQQPTCLL